MRAIVVGASKGIGWGIYQCLQRAGHDVIGMSRTRGECEPWLHLDLCDEDWSVSESVYAALDDHGGELDLLVLSGGMGAMYTPFEESSDRARGLLETNFIGPAEVFSCCLRPLLKTRGAAIFVGSTCADRPSRGMSLYRASKAALHAYARNKRHELKGRVDVSLLAPGWVDTPMTENLKPELKEKICERIPAGRFATVDEVVREFESLLRVPGEIEMTDFTIEADYHG